MTMRKTKNIGRFLPGPLLRQIREHRSESEKLGDAWQRVAARELAEHSAPASYQNQVLTVFVENANWASKLRHQLPDIIKRCQKQDGLNLLANIKIRIEHNFNPVQTNINSKPKNSRISKASADLILESAEHIEDDTLRASMERLGGKIRDTKK